MILQLSSVGMTEFMIYGLLCIIPKGPLQYPTNPDINVIALGVEPEVLSLIW